MPGRAIAGVRIFFQERDLALFDAIAELRQQRGQNRQRAEHRDADDHHRRDPEAEVALVAGEHQPGHRDHHGEAGDEHRSARGGRRGLDRGACALAGRPLFALALEVEERVVDADGEPDQEDHGRGVLIHRDEMARQRHEPDRRQHAGEGEQQRDADGDQRAEDEQQHDDRDRDRPLAGQLQLVAEHLVERLTGADRSGLADVELRMRGRDLRNCSLDRVDLLRSVVVLPLHVERDHRGAAVVRHEIRMSRIQGTLEVLDVRVVFDRCDDVVDRRAERRSVHGELRALHEHELRLRIRLGEALLEDHVGLVRLAAAVVLVLQVLGRDLHAHCECDHHEREPAENGGLPVTRAPAAHAGRDIVRALEG
jgi:hypothetical protein